MCGLTWREKLTRADIEALIAKGAVNLEPAELEVFVVEFMPIADAWAEEYGNVPYPLVHAFLDGFLTALKVMRT